MKKQCPQCDEYYEVQELYNKFGDISDEFIATIEHNIKCPARPGGIDFATWLLWKLRCFLRVFKREPTMKQMITVRLTPDQKTMVDAAAKKAGISTNQFCVEAITNAAKNK